LEILLKTQSCKDFFSQANKRTANVSTLRFGRSQSIYGRIREGEFLEETDEGEESRSSSSEPVSVRGRRGAAEQVSHTRVGARRQRQPPVSSGYFAFILITSGYYFRVTSLFRPATPVIKPPVFLVPG